MDRMEAIGKVSGRNTENEITKASGEMNADRNSEMEIEATGEMNADRNSEMDIEATGEMNAGRNSEMEIEATGEMNADAASSVGSISLIISETLKYFTAKQLNKCACVCSLWREIATSIKRRRHAISWHFFYYCSEGSPDTLHLPVCQPRDNVSCLDAFTDQLDKMQNEPSVVLIFCTRHLFVFPDKFFALRPTTRNQNYAVPGRLTPNIASRHVIGDLLQYLPLNAEVGFITSQGIIGTDSNNSVTKEIESCPAFTAVYFPSLPGVKICRFHLTGMRCSSHIDFAKHTGIPEDMPVKCMLTFLHDREENYECLPYNKIIGHYLQKQDCKMALGGANVKHIYFPRHQQRQKNQSYAVAFIGENVEAASVIIPGDMSTAERITKQLKLMKNSSLLQGQCVAFLFTCTGQGESYYSRTNFQSSIFRDLFPDIPLFGVFATGQIGMNYVPNKRHSSSVHLKPGSWVKSHVSVFVIISFRV